MRLRLRTGTALALGCLLAASALAQTPHQDNNTHTAPPVQTAPPSWDDTFDPAPDLDWDGTWDDDDSGDWRPQTDMDALDAAHKAYLKRADLQLERPEWDEPEPEPPREPSPLSQWLADLFGFLGPVFQYLFYAVVVLVIGGFLYFAFGEALRVRFGRSGKGEVDEGDDVLADLRPDAAAARSLLEEADALARAGKFAEAVHLLLFRSIEDIQTRLEGGVPKSLTAREIGGLGHLPERARRGLGPIIAVVERSFFGGRPVDADGWREARASYEDFAFGEGWA